MAFVDVPSLIHAPFQMALPESGRDIAGCLERLLERDDLVHHGGAVTIVQAAQRPGIESGFVLFDCFMALICGVYKYFIRRIDGSFNSCFGELFTNKRLPRYFGKL